MRDLVADPSICVVVPQPFGSNSPCVVVLWIGPVEFSSTGLGLFLSLSHWSRIFAGCQYGCAVLLPPESNIGQVRSSARAGSRRCWVPLDASTCSNVITLNVQFQVTAPRTMEVSQARVQDSIKLPSKILSCFSRIVVQP